MQYNRRDFLKLGTLASTAMFLPKLLHALGDVPLTNGLSTHRKLVVLQLTGGNDGLNTIIPIKNDLYFKKRTTLGLKANQTLSLTDDVAIHPSLKTIKSLYDNGDLCVLNNVGYPEPDKSHFRSMDIWQSASSSKDIVNTGWLGRYLDNACTQCEHPTQILEFDDLLSLALKGNTANGIAVNSPQKLFNDSNQNNIKQLVAANQQAFHEHSPVSYLYQTLNNTVNSADYIFKESRSNPTNLDYPSTNIGKDFKTIASLIRSNINTSVYYLSHGSFDTHVNQLNTQAKLFAQMDDALSVFIKDLKDTQQWNNTLIMTFSEFGRRVAENASGGTDHGTANVMFLMGGSLKKQGFYNPVTQLDKLINDDLVYDIDFRDVYATILDKWLHANDQLILSQSFKKLDFL